MAMGAGNMKTNYFKRLQWAGCAALLGLAVALASPILTNALGLPVSVYTILLLSLGVSMVSTLIMLEGIMRVRTLFLNTDASVAAIIKGDLDERLTNIGALNEIGICQHRLNNLFDIIDVFIRGGEAMVDPALDRAYYEKISRAALMQRLRLRGSSLTTAPVVEALPAPSHFMPPQLAMPLSAIRHGWDELQQSAERVQQASQSYMRLITSRANGAALHGSESVGEAARRAQQNVEAVAAAAEELSYAINEISQRVNESSKVADRAVEHARHSDRVISGLHDASAKIGAVIKLITDIAEQTNLLALNATIEAARAGDAGRGFAVVASEVKSLADQTAKATGEISLQITTIQESTGAAVAAIQEISRTIEQLSGISTAIAAAVEEQSAATAEISRNIQQAASSTQSVAAAASNIAAPGEEWSETGKTAISASNALAEQIALLDSDIRHLFNDEALAA